MGIIEKMSFGDDVTCRPHKPGSALPSRLIGCCKLFVLDPEPWPDRPFFHRNLSPIFFQPLWLACGLVPGETSANPAFEVGGVLGGVMGSRAEPEGDGESVLSSVILSTPSPDDIPEDPEIFAERRDSPRALVKLD
jgi:hypothetical protein